MPRRSAKRFQCKHCGRRFDAEYPRRYCRPKCCLAAEKKRAGERLLVRCRKIERELAQLIIDATAYNDLHPGQTPIDCEIDRVALSLVRRIIDRIEAGRTVEPELTERLVKCLRA